MAFICHHADTKIIKKRNFIKVFKYDLYKPALENDEISIKPAYKTLPIKYRFSINNKRNSVWKLPVNFLIDF